MGSADYIEFDTPENITVRYPLAGLGTRFAAWMEDGLILLSLGALVFIGLGLSFQSDLFAGFLILLFGAGPALYFVLCEYFWNGQTIGKRSNRIRVIRIDGFRLTFSAVFLRTVFRVIDSLPPLWLVPMFTSRAQRLGDLVAGTVVIHEGRSESNNNRAILPAVREERRFAFSSVHLKALRAVDLAGVTQFLERRDSLSADAAERLASRMAAALALRMGCEPPVPPEAIQFLEDLYVVHVETELRELD